ncbi:AMP-binding protein, partial [Streptomyces sp. NRRL S-495]|uniref:AMP-binding protein n=1 Tax=Streptomyces sp. NRRL S-495 TaxID=1609133 RepID=UPI0005F9901A
AELDARAELLGERLRAAGAGPGTVVALALPRSAETVVALLAVLRSGAASLPLDAEYPADRTAAMLADAAPGLVLTDEGWPLPGLLAGLPVLPVRGPRPEAAPSPAAAPDLADAAYVIYTSGS